MARRVILDTQYTFNPVLKQISIPRIIPKERLLLITNVASNKVIYNFSDPTLVATAWTYTQATNDTPASTLITLSYNTSAMSAADLLQITIDEAFEVIQPDEAFTDPVGKMRMSSPQSLIDTDFEYGLQPTKWESLLLTNNRPTFYYLPANTVALSSITATQGSQQIVCNTYPVLPPPVGTPLQIQDTLFFGANGPFLVEANNTVSPNYTFTYTARYPYLGTTGSIFNSSLTLGFSGAFYANSAFTLSGQPTVSGNTMTITTVEPHGLQVGDGIIVANTSVSGTAANAPNTTFQVATVLNSTQFTTVITANSLNIGTISNAAVYARPDVQVVHRAFDGGVFFASGNQAHNLQTIRQTRRYFRYQSGKGIQMSTGSILKPHFFVDDVSANVNNAGANNITVTTKFPHYVTPGVPITVSGADQSAYNGKFNVSAVLNPVQFQYIANSVPQPTAFQPASPASNVVSINATSWYGSKNRIGMFDSQNGAFFEFDGQTLWAVRRNSITQLSGVYTVTNNSATVTGGSINGLTQPKLSKQLIPGDFVVIRGMSYRVMDITSDNQMTISPPFRGVTPGGPVIISKTVDVRTPSYQWNIDKMDGTGPSGQLLDLAKMQMFYIDYSWYGAGAVRFGLRDPKGSVQYVHRVVNNNQNFMAYMRSGNLPARYETNTFTPTLLMANSVNSSQTSMVVANTMTYTGRDFPQVGTLLIADPAGYEYVNYTSYTGANNSFNGLTRGQATTTLTCTGGALSPNIYTSASVATLQPGMQVYNPNGPTGIPFGTYVNAVFPNAAGAGNNIIQLTQSPTAAISGGLTFVQMAGTAAAHNLTLANTAIPVYLHAPQFAPVISHWGSSVVMDGGFQGDLSLQFVSGEPQQTCFAGQSIALQSIRVSPSVDSGLIGRLGEREIINRMQLQPVAAEVVANGNFLITVVLNGQLSANGGVIGSWNKLANGTSSLAQVCDHSGNVAVTGGENIYGFYAVNSAGANNFSVITADLTKIRDIGNSILGGGFTNNPNQYFYPDGPDMITIVAQNIGTTAANVASRISWTEAQA